MQKSEQSWLIFRLVLMLILGLTSAYSSYRIYKILWRYPWFNRIAYGQWLFFVGIVVFLVIQWFAPGAYRRPDPEVLQGSTLALQWAAFLSLSLLASFAIPLILMDLSFLVTRHLIQWFTPQSVLSAIDPNQRRHFLFQSLPVLFSGISATASLLGTKQAIDAPTLKNVDIEWPDLHPDLNGFTIAQITDLHVGQTIGRDRVESVVNLIHSAKPDLIVLTGDMVDGFVSVLAPLLEPLRTLQAPHGIFYVSGNHEYYWGGEEWIRHFQSLGATPLSNDYRVLKIGKADLLISGTPDHQAPRMGFDGPDLKKALKNAEKPDFHLYLSHQPKGYLDAETVGEQNPVHLQLSGHTHAGQFFPFSLIVSLVHKYYRGLNRHIHSTTGKPMWIYVSSGTGYWGPPNRLGVPSEVTLLKLKRS